MTTSANNFYNANDFFGRDYEPPYGDGSLWEPYGDESLWEPYGDGECEFARVDVKALVNASRWVAWRLVWDPKRPESPPRKIPYDPRTGRWARVPTDPKTYSDRDAAEARKDALMCELVREGRQLPHPGAGVGIGLVLGQLDDGRYLLGTDLDNCHDAATGTIAPWAEQIIDRFDTYSEISPSGTGVKSYFILSARDMEKLHTLLGKDAKGKQLTRRAFAAGEHREIALDTARFYAWTDRWLKRTPKYFRQVTFADVAWFINEAGPAYLVQQGVSIRAETKKPAAPEGMIWRNRDHDIPVDLVDEPAERGPDDRMYQKVRHEGEEKYVPADELVTPPKKKGNGAAKPQLKAPGAHEGAAKPQLKAPGTHERDPTYSGDGFRFMRDRRREGMNFKQALADCFCDTGRAGAWAHTVDDRQHQRAWDNALNYDKDEDGDATDADYPIIDIRAWEGKSAPPRDWLVATRIPANSVTGLYGDGGMGKSILLLMLAVCTVLGRPWLNAAVPVSGPAMIMSCEDEEDELHRRVEAIAAYYQTSYRELAERGLHLSSFSGEDALLSTCTRANVMRPTPLYKALKRKALAIRPRLIGIDNAVDVFGGNEIVRFQVRQFITQLHGLGRAAGSAVVLNAHPSQSGLNTGSGTSGSTGWNNAFRSRLYMRHAGKNEGGEDSDLRVLEVMKVNYGRPRETVQLRWQNGLFVPVVEDNAANRVVIDIKVERRFCELLESFNSQGRSVSPNSKANNYAPTAFAQAAGKPHYSKEDYEQAMERLFADNKLEAVEYGRPSRPCQKLVLKGA
jgi:RecA-family ATPase